MGFMRDILSEANWRLKQNEVNHMELPCKREISLKNLFADALKDELLEKSSLLKIKCPAACQSETSSLSCCELCDTIT
jgi:hypothetical protein